MYLRGEWIQRIEEAFDERSIVWLKGVRRVGKTVLCRSLPNVEYFDCELPRTRQLLKDPEGSGVASLFLVFRFLISSAPRLPGTSLDCMESCRSRVLQYDT